MAIAKPGEAVPIKDLALYAIVRDEKINQAGGIEDYCHRTLPYVEHARILDTGSVDGTREVLEEMQAVYPHLEVGDRAFDGYGPSRNASFADPLCRWGLFLDADERILPAGFEVIRRATAKNEAFSFDVGFLYITPELRLMVGRTPHRTRIIDLIDNPEPIYSGVCGEQLEGCIKGPEINVDVLHFVPGWKGGRAKDHWYANFNLGKPIVAKSAPSDVPDYEEWKRPNPHLTAILDKGFDKWMGYVDSWGYECDLLGRRKYPQ